jgi:outer membrane protein assembly factor BamB
MRVETHGSRVYAITTGDRDTADQEGRVVAFRASDGEILWEDHVPHVARYGNRVFVLSGGKRTVAISALDFDPPDGSFRGRVGAQIRAYDARGQREWDLTLGGAHPEWDFEVRAAAMRGRFLWIAGSVDDDSVVRCYDARDATLMWEDRVTVPDVAGALDSESDSEGADLMVLRGRTLVVAGSKNPQANPSSEDPLVRAYDARDGKVLWTYASSEDEKDEFPRHIALSGSKVVVEWLRSGNDWSTRLDAFDLRTGAVVSQLPLDAIVSDMKAAGRALFLVGNFNGTANPPERDEPEGFVMGIDTRGSLLTTWEARPLYSVQTLEVAGANVYAAMQYFLLAYDPTVAP